MTKDAIERIINGPNADVFRCLFEQLAKIEAKLDVQISKVNLWPKECADYRIDLERRVMDTRGHSCEDPKEQPSKTINVGGYSIRIQTVVFSIVLTGLLYVGSMIAVIGFVIKYKDLIVGLLS